MKPWRASDGQTGGVSLFAEVVTDQVAARRAVTDSETLENAPIGIAYTTPDSRVLRVNEGACRILGYATDELTTKSFQDITHPDDLAARVARLELMRDGNIDRYSADKRYLRRDGTTVWTRVTVSCLRKRDRSIDYRIGVIEDISARKTEEEALRQSEEQFRLLLLGSPLPVLLFDDREQILALSQSWLEETGYSREELRRLEDWTTRAYRERSGEALKYLRQIISTGSRRASARDE